MLELFESFIDSGEGGGCEDCTGNYIFANEAEQLWYEQFSIKPCGEIATDIVAIGHQIERMEMLGQQVDVSTGARVSDYESMMQMAILALRDKEKAGLC